MPCNNSSVIYLHMKFITCFIIIIFIIIIIIIIIIHTYCTYYLMGDSTST